MVNLKAPSSTLFDQFIDIRHPVTTGAPAGPAPVPGAPALPPTGALLAAPVTGPLPPLRRPRPTAAAAAPTPIPATVGDQGVKFPAIHRVTPNKVLQWELTGMLPQVLAATLGSHSDNELQELLQDLKDKKVHVEYGHAHPLCRKLAQDMSVVAYLALRTAPFETEGACGRIAGLMPAEMGALLPGAGEVFTRSTLVALLRAVVRDTAAPGGPGGVPSTAVRRNLYRAELAPIASGSIAAYLDHHIGHSLKSLTNDQLARQQEALSEIANTIRGIDKETHHVLALAGAIHDDMVDVLQDIIDGVFASPVLLKDERTLTELISHFFAGGLRYARFAKDTADNRREHVATAMALGFALLGFAPIVGPFAGLAGLIADKTMRHFWKPKDATPFIRHLADAFLAHATAVMEDDRTDSSQTFRVQFTDVFGASRNLAYEHVHPGLLSVAYAKKVK